MKKMLILDENFRRHLEAFASEVFIHIYSYFICLHACFDINHRQRNINMCKCYKIDEYYGEASLFI